MSTRLLASGAPLPGGGTDPGSAVASFLKRALMLCEARAEVSMNSAPSSVALRSPSSVDTWRLPVKSVLLPTSMMTTSEPRSLRTSAIQRDTFAKEATSARGWRWRLGGGGQGGGDEEGWTTQRCPSAATHSHSLNPSRPFSSSYTTHLRCRTLLLLLRSHGCRKG